MFVPYVGHGEVATGISLRYCVLFSNSRLAINSFSDFAQETLSSYSRIEGTDAVVVWHQCSKLDELYLPILDSLRRVPVHVVVIGDYHT